MEKEGQVRTQAGVCLIWLSSSPFLFTCSKHLKGALCGLVCELGGVGRVEKVDCHCCASFSGMVNRQKGAHNTTFTIHHSPSRIAQTCTANFGSFFQCGFCCQPLKLEGRCLNSLTRSSALTQNAAVSSTPTNFFLLLVTAALSS